MESFAKDDPTLWCNFYVLSIQIITNPCTSCPPPQDAVPSHFQLVENLGTESPAPVAAPHQSQPAALSSATAPSYLVPGVRAEDSAARQTGDLTTGCSVKLHGERVYDAI